MDILQTSASQWQERLQSGQTTSVELIDLCLDQINRHNKQGQCLNALISVAPRDVAHARAKLLDEERTANKSRGPMHGIPVIVKDIFTTDASLEMPTTCGAYALRSAYGKKNCPLVQRLLDAGMIVIGKSNLNEYCRLQDVKSGWSVLGGQSQSPYVKGGLAEHEAPVGNSTISGSSSGSSAAVAAGFAPVAIGTETIGSLVVPANRGGLYALKVTNVRAPLQQVLTLSTAYDSLGPMTKSAIDLRHMIDIILDKSATGEKKMNIRVGSVDPQVWRFPDWFCPLSAEIRENLISDFERTMDVLRQGGIDIVSGIEMSDEDINYEGQSPIHMAVNAEFRDNFARFVAGLEGIEISSLADLIAYNEQHARAALPPPYRDQKGLEAALTDNVCARRVQTAVEHCRREAQHRIDTTMRQNQLDLLLGPGDAGFFGFATWAGYPNATVPWTLIQYDDEHSRPEGLSILGRPGEEDTILDFMLRYEELVPQRPLPRPLLCVSD